MKSLLILAVVLFACASANGSDSTPLVELGATMSSSASAFIEKRMFRNGILRIKSPEKVLCYGPIVYETGYQKARGTIDCFAGETGTVTVELSSPLGEGVGKAIFSGGKEISFRVTMERITDEDLQNLWEPKSDVEIVTESTKSVPLNHLEVIPAPVADRSQITTSVPDQKLTQPEPPIEKERMYAGNGKVEGLIIDAEGVTEAKFNSDVYACKRLKKQAENDVVGDAIFGALLGSAVAKSSKGKYSRRDGAKVGAAAMALDSEVDSDNEKELVFRNCMVGRGYKVLN